MQYVTTNIHLMKCVRKYYKMQKFRIAVSQRLYILDAGATDMNNMREDNNICSDLQHLNFPQVFI